MCVSGRMSLYDTRDVRTWADEAALPGIAELLWEEGVDGAIEMGVGTLVIADKRATFEWSSAVGGGSCPAERRKLTSSIDPLSGRARGDGRRLPEQMPTSRA